MPREFCEQLCGLVQDFLNSFWHLRPLAAIRSTLLKLSCAVRP
jgi:hypothetical protein